MAPRKTTMKIIAHTTGSFQLIDGLSGDLVSAHRPSVVKKTSFITARLAIDQLKIVAEVSDAATDEEFAKHWAEAEGDMDLAIQSFLSIYGVDESVQAESKPSSTKPSTTKASSTKAAK